jgi:hypothetical protein
MNTLMLVSISKRELAAEREKAISTHRAEVEAAEVDSKKCGAK